MHLLKRPDYLFLWCAAAFGLAFLFLTPPLAGGDEKNHFQRVSSIAYGHVLNERAEVPAGIAGFIQEGGGLFVRYLLKDHSYRLRQYLAALAMADYAGSDTPMPVYAWEQYRQLMDIPLQPDSVKTLRPNYITTYLPLAYAPQLLAFAPGAALGASPLPLLYMTRAAGLVAGIGLGFLAIQRIPSRKYLLAALLLLPTVTFYRSHLNADIMVCGLAFLFIAYVLREAVRPGRIKTKTVLKLALVMALLGPCKSVYCVLALASLIIPKERFGSTAFRLKALGAIILPGLAGALAWTLLMKRTYFSGLSYPLDGIISPDAQAAFILHHPWAYLKILFHTLFLTPFFADAGLGILGDFGWGIHLFPPVYVALIFLLMMVAASDRTGESVQYPQPIGWAVAGIYAIFLPLSLTLFYMQWSRVGAPGIMGFQGRYFYPLLPLLLPFARPLDTPPAGSCGLWLLILACVGLAAGVWAVKAAYFG